MKFDPFADLRDFKGCASGGTAGDRAASVVELAQYKALTPPAAAAAAEILAFWQQSAELFLILSMTARRILCISASSAQSERDFSSVGHSITEMRSRLSVKKIEAIELVRSGMRLGVL